ncbi:MAG: pro-sigmaK processing inhibitor BofA family protein [Oscillospiraceae bacterium]
MPSILIIILAILAVIMIIYYAKSNKKIVKLLLGVFSGIVLLYPLHYLLALMGISLAVNYTTIAISGILGIAGLTLLTVTSFLI